MHMPAYWKGTSDSRMTSLPASRMAILATKSLNFSFVNNGLPPYNVDIYLFCVLKGYLPTSESLQQPKSIFMVLYLICKITRFSIEQ